MSLTYRLDCILFGLWLLSNRYFPLDVRYYILSLKGTNFHRHCFQTFEIDYLFSISWHLFSCKPVVRKSYYVILYFSDTESEIDEHDEKQMKSIMSIQVILKQILIYPWGICATSITLYTCKPKVFLFCLFMLSFKHSLFASPKL